MGIKCKKKKMTAVNEYNVKNLLQISCVLTFMNKLVHLI